MIGLTTGRRTSQELNRLLKDMAHSIPNARILRRGKSSLTDIAKRLQEEGIKHAVTFHKWPHGLARMDFWDIGPTGITELKPSILLRSAKLRRQYVSQGRYVAECITCDSAASAQTRNLSHTLSKAFELPESNVLADQRLKAAFQVSERADGSIQLTVSSPPSQNEVGPTLVISRLLWDADDES